MNLLIIEDNLDDQEFYRRLLKNDKYKIYEAETGEEGFNLYKKHHIDCILLDYYLPGESGLETLVELKKIDKHIPVVMLTGKGSEMLAVEAMKTGVQEYLIKGEIDLAKLQCAIANTIEKVDLQRKLDQRNMDLECSNIQLQKALDELQKTQQKIIQQERMRALGEMTSGIAHDFNNALSPIIGFTDLVLNVCPHHLENKDKMKRYLQLIQKSAIDASKIVQRMNKFYSFKKEEYNTVNLSVLAKEVKMLTQPKWKDQAQAEGKTIEFVCEEKKDLFILGDENELRELLINLIFNAIDSIFEQGKISIQTYLKANEIFLKVIDTGKGMSEEVRRRCFEPFFTTKDSSRSGLGLAMVYGIVQRHNGVIDVKSTPGKGTIFTIALPSQKKSSIPFAEEEEVFLDRSLSILVVDDELRNRAFLTELLEADGHVVETATDGNEALEKFAIKKPNVLITDLAMPGIKGDFLASKIKESNPQTPIIMLTGFGDIIEHMTKKPNVIDEVLTKPVRIDKLRKALAKVANLNC